MSERDVALIMFSGIQRADAAYPDHINLKNTHRFEAKDLEKLIQKVNFDIFNSKYVCSQ